MTFYDGCVNNFGSLEWINSKTVGKFILFEHQAKEHLANE